MDKNRQIKNYINKNQIDYEKIIHDFTPYIYKIIRNTVGNNISDEDIEEIISDCFIVLWKNKANIDTSKSLSSYLAGISKILIKKKYRDIHSNYDIQDFEDSLCITDNIEDIILEHERNSLLLSELNKMSVEDKTIFIKFYYNGKKIKQIAKELGINDFTAKTKLCRIRKKLKKILEERGYGNGF